MAEEKKTTAKKAPAAKKPVAKAPAKKPAPEKVAAPVEAEAAVEAKVEVKAKVAAVKVDDARRPYRKSRQGYVVSDKMDKTIVVQIEERSKHPLYGKVVKKYKKFKAHDEENTAGIGDLVIITETRPLSATKRWRLSSIVERSK
jgi:small subunit ribosomal protein S17